MKKLLYLLFAFLIFACSSDETNIDEVDEVNPITGRWNFIKMEYIIDGVVSEPTSIYYKEFAEKNGCIRSWFDINPDGTREQVIFMEDKFCRSEKIKGSWSLNDDETLLILHTKPYLAHKILVNDENYLTFRIVLRNGTIWQSEFNGCTDNCIEYKTYLER